MILKVAVLSVAVSLLMQIEATAQQCVPKKGEICWISAGTCVCFPAPVTIVPLRVNQYIDLKIEGIVPEALPGVVNTLKKNETKLELQWNDKGLSGIIKGLSDKKASRILEDLGRSDTELPKE